MLPSWLVRKARQSRVALHDVGRAVRILGIEHSLAKIYAGHVNRHVSSRFLITKVQWVRQVVLDWNNLYYAVVSTLGACTDEIWPLMARIGIGQAIKLGCNHQEEQELFLRKVDKLEAEVALAHGHWVPLPTVRADPLHSTPAHVSPRRVQKVCHGLYKCPLKVHMLKDWYSGWEYLGTWEDLLEDLRSLGVT